MDGMTIKEYFEKMAEATLVPMLLTMMATVGSGIAWWYYPTETLAGFITGTWGEALLILWLFWRYFLSAAESERKKESE